MLLETISQPFRLVRSANSTDSSFASKVPTADKPSGAGVLDLGGFGVANQNGVMLVPFGTGSDGDTFSLRVLAWHWISDPTITKAVTTLWVPALLCELSVTLSSGNPGVAGTILGSSNYFAKSISLTTGNANVSTETVSPATSGVLAHATVDMKGAQMLEVIFTTGSSATDCNALYKFF
jgi:hypothetical protein